MEAERKLREAEMLKRFDKNGDGKLDDEEKKAMADARKDQAKDLGKGRRETILKRFDKDGDGKLSDEERKTMQDAMKDRAKGKGAKGKGQGDGDDKKPDEKSKPN